MAKVFFNVPLNLRKGIVWEKESHPYNPVLAIFSKLTAPPTGEVDNVEATVSFVDGVSYKMIILSDPGKNDNKTIGIFMNDYCGFQLLYSLDPGFELYRGESLGCGTLRSHFGI